MGIKRLLSFLSDVLRKCHISEFRGQKIGIDGYVWLHRGAVACSKELVTDIKTEKFLSYGLKMLDMLQEFGITPVVVLDGGKLPMKQEEEASRKKRREEQKELVAFTLRNNGTVEGDKIFQKCIDITPEMASQFVQVLKKRKIEYIVAPYEADAQLAYLCRIGYIDCCITEDSDLIPYGAKNIIYKLDTSGQGQYFEWSVMESKQKFCNFTQRHIITMCVLSGCDYVDSVPGVGISSAYQYVKSYHSVQRILEKLKSQKYVADWYEVKFIQALMTFKYQRVYCPKKRRITHVSSDELPDSLKGKCNDFLGPHIEQKIAVKIAEGKLNPVTHQKFEDKRPIYPSQKLKSVTKTTPTSSSGKYQTSLPNYFKRTKKRRSERKKKFTRPLSFSSASQESSTPSSQSEIDVQSIESQTEVKHRSIKSFFENHSIEQVLIKPNTKRKRECTEVQKVSKISSRQGVSITQSTAESPAHSTQNSVISQTTVISETICASKKKIIRSM